MAKLADVQDLGSCAARRVGSTPTIRTKTKGLLRESFCFGATKSTLMGGINHLR